MWELGDLTEILGSLKNFLPKHIQELWKGGET